MMSIFNRKITRCFFVSSLLTFNTLFAGAHTPLNNVYRHDKGQAVSSLSSSDEIQNNYNTSKKSILYGMKRLKTAVELIVGKDFKAQDVEKFIRGIDSNKPFRYSNMDVDPNSDPLIKKLYKPLLESWLILREACNTVFVHNKSRNPVVGMSKKDALSFALTLGQSRDMGTYRRMSAIDFMEWWADSNNVFLTRSEQQMLRRISYDNKYTLSKKFTDVDDMWENGNASEFMEYWKLYGENTLSDAELHMANDPI